MVQGSLKGLKSHAKNSRQLLKEIKSKQKAKKGHTLQLPNGKFRGIAIEDRQLSKAIDKANEQKVAAKLIQGGGKLQTKDILQKGKELNKELRRNQVKKKLGRVEEKLNELKSKAESQGLL